MRLLPSSLGSLDRAWALTGAEALREVRGLHLGTFRMAEAEVAGYGEDATLWVATPDRPEAADRYVTRMAQAIASADTPFDPPLDVFVQVSAGVRLTEPASDLAVAAALLSSVLNRPVPPDALFLGELGLGGEIRPVGGRDRRLVEAGRLGFRRVFATGRGVVPSGDIRLVGLDRVEQLVQALAA